MSIYPARRTLKSGLIVTPTREEHAKGLEELQEIVFPTLAAEERFKEAHYKKHIEIFPEGQLVVLDGDRVVGMTSTIRLHFDFEHPGHTFADIIQGGWLTSHDPSGDWLYGADLGAHPGYRRRGIARALYAERHEIVRRLGLKGQVTVGMMSGYGARMGEITAEDYYEGVKSRAITDPTLSAQIRVGFEPRGLLPGYINDPVCDNYGVCLVLPSDRDVRAET